MLADPSRHVDGLAPLDAPATNNELMTDELISEALSTIKENGHDLR